MIKCNVCKLQKVRKSPILGMCRRCYQDWLVDNYGIKQWESRLAGEDSPNEDYSLVYGENAAAAATSFISHSSFYKGGDIAVQVRPCPAIEDDPWIGFIVKIESIGGNDE